jgi:hypothetical protein
MMTESDFEIDMCARGSWMVMMMMYEKRVAMVAKEEMVEGGMELAPVKEN